MLHNIVVKSAVNCGVSAFTSSGYRMRRGYSHMKGRLSVTINMGNDPLKDWRLVRRGAYIGIQVLKFDLLSTKIVAKSTEFTAAILIALLVIKDMIFNALPHRGGILFQWAIHIVQLYRSHTRESWKRRLIDSVLADARLHVSKATAVREAPQFTQQSRKKELFGALETAFSEGRQSVIRFISGLCKAAHDF